MNALLIIIGVILFFGSGFFAVYEYISGGMMIICWLVGLALIGIGTRDN